MAPETPQRRFYCDGQAIWYIDTIWAAAVGLPAEDLSIDQVRELDEVCWFSDVWGKRPTCRAVLDGVHRIGKAMLAGHKPVRALRLPAMPPPDERLSPDDPRYDAGQHPRFG